MRLIFSAVLLALFVWQEVTNAFLFGAKSNKTSLACKRRVVALFQQAQKLDHANYGPSYRTGSFGPATSTITKVITDRKNSTLLQQSSLLKTINEMKKVGSAFGTVLDMFWCGPVKYDERTDSFDVSLNTKMNSLYVVFANARLPLHAVLAKPDTSIKEVRAFLLQALYTATAMFQQKKIAPMSYDFEVFTVQFFPKHLMYRLNRYQLPQDIVYYVPRADSQKIMIQMSPLNHGVVSKKTKYAHPGQYIALSFLYILPVKLIESLVVYERTLYKQLESVFYELLFTLNNFNRFMTWMAGLTELNGRPLSLLNVVKNMKSSYRRFYARRAFYRFRGPNIFVERNLLSTLTERLFKIYENNPLLR